MRNRVLLTLSLCVLVGLAGCTGSVADPSGEPTADPSTDRSTPTTTETTLSPTDAVPPISDEEAGERAIAAEKARIGNVTADWENRTDLSFGILRPAEYEVRSRNASGVVLSVTVGYSTSFSCGTSVDGAATTTRYVVTPETVRLVAVEQDVPESPSYC
ncbi:hypothetical protein [Salinigranum sp. GCM10025319]|uniref:hypothetical protein n=1 Tax=Salinigranum sp. GCM10025319 TaxID=3252687 RepID=UPI003614A104